MATRQEKDSLGIKDVPQEAYYGVQTLRAIENFPISGFKPHSLFVDATVLIKKAAARVNAELGSLEKEKAQAILQAADEVLTGKHRDQFVVDTYQAGAGTSHNMNVNEVLANRANEILGGQRGTYDQVHPNDHVNMSQSTNDVIPTAVKVSGILLWRKLDPALEGLQKGLEKKTKEFDKIIKSGRTHLQDATPVRLGQEFSGYASVIQKNRKRIDQAISGLRVLGIGGTAVGTGLNSHPQYREKMPQVLSEFIGEKFTATDNYFEAMQSASPVLAVSGALRVLATDLIRIANDFRLLSSGPSTGIQEIRLPAVQPGSSIMPAKINPVMAEMLDMIGFQVIGLDTAVTLAAQAGQLELNVMFPLIAWDLCHMMEILTNAVGVFTQRCVNGIQANETRCRELVEKNVSIVTALNPYIGYAKAAEIGKEALETGKKIRDLVIEKKLLPKDKLDKVFDFASMTEPNIQ